MKPRRTPSLAQIEARWFSPSDRLLARIADHDPTVPEDQRRAVLADADYAACVEELRRPPQGPVEVAPLRQPPAWFAELAAKRSAARQSLRQTRPGPGVIVTLERLAGPQGELPIDLPATAAVLLDGEEAKGVWYGWLVAAETAYASYWDYVLGEADGPFDPSLAGMVQLWNPLRIHAQSIGCVIAALPPERLQAVRAMAGEYLARPLETMAIETGQLAQRPTLQGYAVTTGAPLQGPQDPRWRYQEIYLQVAKILREPARQALAATAKPWWQRFWEALIASSACQPLPEFAAAMQAGQAAEENRQALLGNSIRLRLEEGADGVMRLHLSRIGAGGSLRLTRRGETLQTLGTEDAQAVFLLDHKPGYALDLLDQNGTVLAHIELDTAEE